MRFFPLRDTSFGIAYHLSALETDSEIPFTLHGTAAGFRFAKTNNIESSPTCKPQMGLLFSNSMPPGSAA
jgi:hypothetical protein